MEVSEVERAIKEAIADYKIKYAIALKELYQMVSDVLDSEDSFRVFWAFEQLRKDQVILSERALVMKAKWESRN